MFTVETTRPDIVILTVTKDWALLQCEVQGASAKLNFQDSSGNIVPAEEPQVKERGGSYIIILQTTVKKTDYYRCIATQEENSNQSAMIYVYLCGKLLSTHPSILYLSTRPLKGCRNAEAFLSCHWARDRVQPGQVTNLSQAHRDRQPFAF